MSYLHSIRSIHEVHPTLPVVLGNVDLNIRHAEDDNIEPEHVQHAKFVATALRSVQGQPLLPFFFRAITRL